MKNGKCRWTRAKAVAVCALFCALGAIITIESGIGITKEPDAVKMGVTNLTTWVIGLGILGILEGGIVFFILRCGIGWFQQFKNWKRIHRQRIPYTHL
jgi:hypothetical protein